MDRGLLPGDKLFTAAAAAAAAVAAGTVVAGGLVAGMGPSDQLGMYCKAYYRRINGLRVSRAISQMSFFTGMAGPGPRANAHRHPPDPHANAHRHPAAAGNDLKSC